MLKIAKDKVAEVIILARELNRAEPEFDAFVSGLTETEQAGLVAVMWVGRGSFEPEEYGDAFQTALQEATVPTKEYLKQSPHLSDHLENGLDALGVSAADEEDDLYSHR